MAEEKTFENKVKKFIEEEGGWQVKFFANQMTKKGIPDVLACINGYFVGIEIKAQHGRYTMLQLHHCEEIRKAGGFSFILYPSGYEQFKKFVKDLNAEIFDRDKPITMK